MKAVEDAWQAFFAAQEAQRKWDARFMEMADLVATWSKDRSDKTYGVGCVLVNSDRVVLALGYNGLPRGLDDDHERHPERHTRPMKYLYAEHAERNAVFNAARTETSLLGAIAYVNWVPCADCARALAQVGICRVVGRRREGDSARAEWVEHFEVARTILKEAGVTVEVLPS